MMQQITYPLTLEGERVKLVPLEETHFEELITASTDERIWQFLSINGYDRTELLPSLKEAHPLFHNHYDSKNAVHHH